MISWTEGGEPVDQQPQQARRRRSGWRGGRRRVLDCQGRAVLAQGEGAEVQRPGAEDLGDRVQRFGRAGIELAFGSRCGERLLQTEQDRGERGGTLDGGAG
jgi:hypothetical protein